MIGLIHRVNHILHSNASQPDGRVDYPAGAEATAVRFIILHCTWKNVTSVIFFSFAAAAAAAFARWNLTPPTCMLLRRHCDLYWYNGIIISNGFDQGPMHWDLMLEFPGWIKWKGDFWIEVHWRVLVPATSVFYFMWMLRPVRCHLAKTGSAYLGLECRNRVVRNSYQSWCAANHFALKCSADVQSEKTTKKKKTSVRFVSVCAVLQLRFQKASCIKSSPCAESTVL